MLLLLLALANLANSQSPRPVATNLSQTIIGNVTATFQKSFMFLLDEEVVARKPVRVSAMATSATSDNPIVFTARQILGVTSFTIPLNDRGYSNYKQVARTLCPDWNKKTGDTQLFLAVDVSSSDVVQREYQLRADLVENFDLVDDVKITANITPSTPMFFRYKIDQTRNAPVLIKVTSENRLCATVSIQQDYCPIHDLMYDIEYEGMYQSMSTIAAITVTPKFTTKDDFIVVVVVHPTDYTCEHLGHDFMDAMKPQNSSTNSSNSPDLRLKNVVISVTPSMGYREYIFPTLITVGLLLIIYLLAYVGTILETEKFIRGFNIDFEYEAYGDEDVEEGVEAPTNSNVIHEEDRDEKLVEEISYGTIKTHKRRRTLDSIGSVDYCEDINEVTEIRRTKVELSVADLSYHSNEYKYRLYQWNLIPIAVFYALPVLQLVAGIQLLVYYSGNQNICYYNFLCSRPLGVLQQFNNIFSNTGYVLLGILFLLIVKHRDTKYQAAVKDKPIIAKQYGLPQHNGIYYAVGISLCMEGLLSASYHVCPTGYNFQFDSTFMYLMSGLLMLKIYQLRHPDVNPHAYTSYIFLSLIVIMEVIGVYVNNIYFWTIFGMFYIVATLYFTSHMYYMGVISLDCGLFARVSHFFRNDLRSSLKPMYIDRFIYLVLVVTLNFVAAILGVVFTPSDFPSFLLAVFLLNLMVYFIYYLIMKFIHGEYPYPITIFCGVLTICTWIAALYFYFSSGTNWQLPASQSRQKNTPCLVLDFYDDHDVWHIISSMALFFGFVTVLTLDDHLLCKPRKEIRVF